MNHTELKNLFNKFINYQNIKFDKGDLFVFKSLKDKKTKNPNINLKYNIINVKMSKNVVIENTKRLLSYFLSNIFKDDIELQLYDINNSKKVIDYMNLEDFDFSDTNIVNGILNDNSNVNHYKICYFINELKKTKANIKNTSDFDTMRYTCTHAHTNDGDNIFIINKCKPLIKTEKAYYVYEPNEDDDCVSDFKIINKNLFKMPYYPSMVIINDLCIFIDDKIELIFGFEDLNRKVCEETLSSIKKDFILSDTSTTNMDKLSKIKKHYNQFADFNDSRLKALSLKESNETKDFLIHELKINLNFNEEEKKPYLDLDKPEKASIFLEYITGHIKREPDSTELVSVGKSTPLNT
ncbi:hypothetical protein [Clostridium sp.]|uniref:hypothetical protein n=1 Tax=Clostridium sp. TaxID=1506 RepID=UPI0026333009|nr:hypothetical protein [Clostridium sp.]